MTTPLRITLKNYKAIKSATVDLNGITVVSGVNGSGKSSISKLLYYTLKYANRYEDLVDKSLKEDLWPVRIFLRTVAMDFRDTVEAKMISENLQKANGSMRFQERRDAYVSSLKLVVSMNTPKGTREQQLVRRWQYIIESDIFGGRWKGDENMADMVEAVIRQVEDRFDRANRDLENRSFTLLKEALEEVGVEVKGGQISEYDVPIVGKDVKSVPIPSYVQQAVYIDTPMAVGFERSNMSAEHRFDYWGDLTTMLSKPLQRSYSHSLYQDIRNVISGEAFQDRTRLADALFKYRRDDGLEVDLVDSATGVRSFSILQMLLKNGTINRNTMLIIDEPEAHLHPQWIVEYAQLVVMMHKKVGAKFFIASHSTDFVSAIKYIARKEKVGSSLSFYIAEEDMKQKHSYQYRAIGDDIEPIFEAFNKSLDKISEYGYE